VLAAESPLNKADGALLRSWRFISMSLAFRTLSARTLGIVVTIVALGLDAGCAAKSKPQPVGPATIMSSISSPRPLPRVVIGPGDVLDVKFFDLPELNESQAVRPDGKIALQLIGDVDVAGLSPSEITENLRTLYQPHLLNPKIAVVVRSLKNNRVFVGGEVKTPGSLELTSAMTPLEAIIQAGGFDMRSAQVKNVVLIRHADGKRYGYNLNLQDAQSVAATNDFYLEPFDIIWVPRTTIAKVDQWIDQYINQIVPQFGLIYTHRINDTTTIGIDTRR
jgi:protein involved in polysaccharide export with SLBB domain